MAGRVVHRLNALSLKDKKPGLQSDGLGLYLQVTKGGSRSWIYRYSTCGKLRDMGLGAIHTIGLADARQAAQRCRKLRLEGRDPIETRRAERSAASLEVLTAMTFDQCRDAYIAAKSVTWRNDKHRKQWTSSLQTYCTPIFGKLPVQLIDTRLVQKALETIWTTKPESAGRVRGRIEAILDWATVNGNRKGENPARWRGHLEKLLADRSKFHRVKHHSALPHSQIAEFLAELRSRSGGPASALAFLIACASRSGEVLGARWQEIDLTRNTWTIPGSRMKSGRDHRVPLSRSAIDILERLLGDRVGTDCIFKSDGARLSTMAMAMTIRRMGRVDITIHGFRATFKTWASECTHHPNHIVETALAHVNGDKVEAAYH